MKVTSLQSDQVGRMPRVLYVCYIMSNAELQCCVMAAIQTHIDSPVTEIRHVGMVVGEQLMNWLHPGGAHPLAFEYEPSAVTEELRKLARCVSQHGGEWSRDEFSVDLQPYRRKWRRYVQLLLHHHHHHHRPAGLVKAL